MLSATLTVGVVTTLVKAAGAAKLVAVARVFGTGDALDAFLIAFLLPSFAAELIGSSFTAALVPAFIDVRERQGRAAAGRLFSSIAALSLALLSAAALVTFAARRPLLRILASGFSAGKLAFAETLLVWMLPLVVLIGLSAVWRAVLNAGRRFALAAAAPAMTPLLTIVLLSTPAKAWGAYALAAGTVVGTVLELALVARALKQQGLPLMPRWYGLTPRVREVIAQYAPMLAGAVLTSGAVLIDPAMAAMLGPGSVSALSYGTKLATVVLAIGPLAVSTAALPHFSLMTAAGDLAGLRKALRTYSLLTILATLPLTIALVWLSGPLTRMLFQRGAFAHSDAELVTAVQRCSFLQIPFAMLTALMARTVSSMRANRALLWGAMLSLVVNAASDYLLMNRLGVTGIALARAVTALVSFAYLTRILQHLLKDRAAAGVSFAA
jgi:putative peptidoglycan lipid II flippase